MKDKEILSHILNLAESLQSHEEIEVMQVKALHGRIDNLQNVVVALIKILRLTGTSGQDGALQTLENLLTNAQISEGFSKLLAKMESGHEVKSHQLAEIQQMIRSLPD